MANKLQNIKALKQMLSGNHHSQTKKTFYFGRNEKKLEFEDKKRSAKVGDAIVQELTTTNGMTSYRTHFCIGLNSFHTVSGKWKSKEEYDTHQKEIRDILNPFKACNPDNESCTKSHPSKIDEKLARKTGMCDSCLAKFELQLQIGGKFNNYAMEKMRNNLKSWMRDQEIELTKWKEDLQSGVSYLNNSEGNESSMENWEGDVDGVIKRFETEFYEMKKMMFDNYGISEDE
jgi:hypothetical protein